MEKTMIHPETGEILYRDVRQIEYTYRNESIIVDQPGWYPKNGNTDDGILLQEDMKIAGNTTRVMKARYQQKLQEKSFGVGNLSLA